ncbi:MAG: DUF3899 domain-containing protein [Clostridia bacterium]|nr:DUF3899 domain-containing protein [Clostridia bacterium]
MKAKRSVINCAVGALMIIVLYFAVHHDFDWQSSRRMYTHLSNAFSIAGMLLLLSALEGWLRKQHALDWPGYSLYLARFLLRQARRRRMKQEEETPLSFPEFRKEQEPELKSLILWPRVWIGLFFLAMGALFVLLR